MDTSARAIARAMPWPLQKPATAALSRIQQGTFQRSMSVLVAATSVVTGLEVAYEHYRGGYSNPVMYSPVILSGVLTVAATASVFSERAARTFLRWTSFITLLDGVTGFGFHIRGIARKPGGWRLPVTNLVMGPPLFAPLLFGTSAYLGWLASYLRREEDHSLASFAAAEAKGMFGGVRSWKQDIRTGQFQKHLAGVTAVWTFCSGAEAMYSHYKNNFRYRVEWTPIVLTPALMFAAIGAIFSRRIANTWLPLLSAGAMVAGLIGTGYHVRGILRRPGGANKPLYNILYGPPIFAPMLFAACGMLGMLAYLMRREKK